MTQIVNLFGAPGAGKSTTRAGVFSRLKELGVNCEEVTEVAKNLVWEERWKTLESQPYIFGKQLRDMERLVGKVDVIITDSPILLSCFYSAKKYIPSFAGFVVDQFRAMGGSNFLIERVKPYNPAGRMQTEEQSDQIAVELKTMLDTLNVGYTTVAGNRDGQAHILKSIVSSLEGKQ